MYPPSARTSIPSATLLAELRSRFCAGKDSASRPNVSDESASAESSRHDRRAICRRHSWGRCPPQRVIAPCMQIGTVCEQRQYRLRVGSLRRIPQTLIQFLLLIQGKFCGPVIASSQRPGLRRERADSEIRRRWTDLKPAIEGAVGKDGACFPQIFGMCIKEFDPIIKSISLGLNLRTAFSAP